MTVKDASYLALETAFNQYLALDPEISQRFAELHGRSVGIELLGTGIKLFFIPEQNGRVQVLSHLEAEPDCLISGTLPALLRSSGDAASDQLFSGNVKISGDTGLAQKFTRLLLQVDIDLEEQLSRLTGDVIAHEVGNRVRQTSAWLQRARKHVGLDMQEYLQEEIRVLPNPIELQNFFADVDDTRDAVERLEARVQRLQQAGKNN
ncbi:MAG: SCP2 sterol-binding domain-containing protein [Chromatiales bacterium]|jgi:ubiquinone biosynthesis protein UbiJ